MKNVRSVLLERDYVVSKYGGIAFVRISLVVLSPDSYKKKR